MMRKISAIMVSAALLTSAAGGLTATAQNNETVLSEALTSYLPGVTGLGSV